MNHRARCDEKRLATQPAQAAVPQPDFDMMIVGKLRAPANEFETPILQLLAPIIRKLADQAPLARADRPAIHAEVLGPQSKLPRPADRLRAARRLQERFARHAPAQNAQAADLVSTLDHHRLQTKARSRCRRRVSGAASADDYK